ncbi:MAG: hypothetical protein JWM65_3837 [Sphingomonas bacterium]|jgi:hypothetical protein|nr:hypothetical protein [Sphingomonas bacterium]
MRRHMQYVWPHAGLPTKIRDTAVAPLKKPIVACRIVRRQ